ncbi:hypothetical protein [Streptomyces sp. NRRL S-1813]|uniref:hypothetical protein n=1 Tax=Streptomyces sp. NRRL S-1813 TaxID=1463888 RepID=UPI0004CC5C98|nr:hypothetical protein [Streptomyces sp. NRRL S-1813]
MAAALLVAAPLAGTASPAAAADGQNAPIIDKSKVYESDADINKAMEGWAKVEASESVMGYPKGADRDNPVSLPDVMPKYDPTKALADAKAAAKKFAEDKYTPKWVGESAKQLADSAITDPETSQNTNDDNIATAMSEKNPASSYREGRHPDGSQNSAGTNPCVFVGVLDDRPGSKYPKLGTGGGIAGGGKKTYSVSGQVTDEKSATTVWSVGGKFTPKVTSTPANGGAGGEIGGEIGFTYSYSSTSLNRVTGTQEDKYETEFPADKKGSLQGRRDGAYYVGYLFVQYQAVPGAPGTGPEKEHIKAIPARVYVQSPKSSTPVTYFKYQEPAPQ